MVEFKLDMFLLGCAGGLLPDILRIIQNKYELKVPDYLRSPMFWVGLIFQAGVGGLAAWLLGATEIKPALAYGFGAPEILSKLFGKIAGGTDRGIDRGDQEEKPAFKLSTWWGS